MPAAHGCHEKNLYVYFLEFISRLIYRLINAGLWAFQIIKEELL